MPYKISFTSGGLFAHDAVKVAELYLRIQDWDALRKKILEENILQARTPAWSIRASRELIHRLKVLTDAQLRLLILGTRQEQNQILWLAACKHYAFVRDFTVEVLREKYLHLDWEITYADFDRFFYDKAEWHEELARITENTRKKLRQMLFKMMTEAEILSSANLLQPTLFSPEVAKVIAEDDPAYLAVFPISDADIQKAMP